MPRKHRSHQQDWQPYLKLNDFSQFRGNSVDSETTCEPEHEKVRIYGTIWKLWPNHGLIKPDDDAQINGFVHFYKSEFRGGLEFPSLKRVLYKGQRVWANVIPASDETPPTRWNATLVALEGSTFSNLSGDIRKTGTSQSSNASLVSLKKSYELHGHEESLMSPNSYMDKCEGVIKCLFTSWGFIKLDNYDREVYFDFSNVMNVPYDKTVEEVLQVGQNVNFDAIQSTKDKNKWKATEVWLHGNLTMDDMSERKVQDGQSTSATGPPPCCSVGNGGGEQDKQLFKDTMTFERSSSSDVEEIPWSSRQKVKEEVGKIYPYSKTEARIECRKLKYPVLVLSEVVYLGACPVQDLITSLQDGVEVIFNAISDEDCPAKFHWKATLVCVGNKMFRKPDAVYNRKIWEALKMDYRKCDIVQKKAAANSNPPSAVVKAPSIVVEDLLACSLSFEDIVSEGDGSSSDEDDRKRSLDGKTVLARISSVQQNRLEVLVNGLNHAIRLPANIIYVNCQKVEASCHLNNYFKKGDMITVKFGNIAKRSASCRNPKLGVTLAWYGKKPDISKNTC